MSMQHGVVIGSGMAGLLAARVLSDHCDRVTVIERDAEPLVREPRKGVPQGHQVHVLLKAGELALKRLFPGILGELEAAGSVRFDFANDARWYHHGVWKASFDSGFTMHQQSRALLEQVVRRRVAARADIELRYGTAARGLHCADGRVRAVALTPAESTSRLTLLAADLVVDCSGRGSRLPQWLHDSGHQGPEETRIPLDLQYTSRHFRKLIPAPKWTTLSIYPYPPQERRAGLILPRAGHHGDNAWHVMLAGYLGERAPAGLQGFLGFARSLPQPEIYQVIRDLEPLGDAHIYRFPYARRRHYERLYWMPRGVLAIGDSVCSFDPLLGQGMTVAALSAQALAEYLIGASHPIAPQPFFERIARIEDAPWQLTSSEVLRYPEIPGPRPPWLPALQWYIHQVHVLSGSSPDVYARFLRVMHLLASPQTLFHPSVARRVLARAWSQRRDWL